MYTNIKPKFEQDFSKDAYHFSHVSDNVYYSFQECRMVTQTKKTKYVMMYSHEVLSLYHNLAKECNGRFGTEFPYSQELIDKLTFYKPKNHSGKSYNVSHRIRENASGHYELLHHYWYERFRRDCFGIDSISTSTCGEYDQAGIITIVRAAKEVVDSNKMQNISKRILLEQNNKQC